MKNIDRIRQMTVDELAELLSCACDNYCASSNCNSDCVISIKQWLQQEAEDT